MKRRILTLVALSASILTAATACGQNKDKAGKAGATAPAAATPPPTKLVRVATLENAQANREFTANVQLVQAQRQAAVELQGAIGKEKDAKKKAELQKQLDAVMKKLNENNELMFKTYGFSINRNYIMEVERANIYLQVTDEEAAKLEQAAKAQPAKNAKK